MQKSIFNPSKKVFIVAEIGNNHEGSFNNAKELIFEASKAGVDAVKFQTFIPEKFISIENLERIKILKGFELTKKEIIKLSQITSELGMIFFSTPLDIESAIFLNNLQSIFKISSGDNNFFPLINKIFEFEKPTIISTGLCDIELLLKLYKKWENSKFNFPLAFLHCVSSYPVPDNQANLSVIQDLILKFPKAIIGYSDHTLGIDSCCSAVSMGAKIIEKHFTLDKNYSNFRDHQLSADPEELRKLVLQIRKIEQLRGDGIKKVEPCEKDLEIVARRSIAAARDIGCNETIKFSDLIWVRPGTGIAPGNEEIIIGKKTKNHIKKGEIIYPTMVIKE